MITTDGGMEEEMACRVLERRKVLGTMAKGRKENIICREVKREIYEQQ